MVRDGSAYLITNEIELVMANIDCFCDRANPTVVIFRVVKCHNGFYARPNIVVWMDAEATFGGCGCNIGVHEAQAFGRFDGARIDIRYTC